MILATLICILIDILLKYRLLLVFPQWGKGWGMGVLVFSQIALMVHILVL